MTKVNDISDITRVKTIHANPTGDMKQEHDACGAALVRYLALFGGREDHFAQQIDSGYIPVDCKLPSCSRWFKSLQEANDTKSEKAKEA